MFSLHTWHCNDLFSFTVPDQNFTVFHNRLRAPTRLIFAVNTSKLSLQATYWGQSLLTASLHGVSCGPGSSVGIATELRAGRSGNRIPVGRGFPPFQTVPGAHPASYTMGTGSFPGVNYGRGMLLTTHPLPVPRSWKSRAITLPTLCTTTGPVMGSLYLYLLRGVSKNTTTNKKAVQ